MREQSHKEGTGMKLILTAAVDKLVWPVTWSRQGRLRPQLPHSSRLRHPLDSRRREADCRHQRSRDAREIRGLDHAQEVREQLEGLTTISARAGDTGRLFGAVRDGG